MKTEKYIFNGYEATIIIPDKPNGEWLWKTEFLYAFDALERKLCEDGFTRVYYQISNKYGSPDSVELMHDFYLDLMNRYKLNKKAILIGFSRGGLYAFNFALKYPSCVKKMYLDSPVLDLRTWPKKEDIPELYKQVLDEYHFSSDEEMQNYQSYPVYKLKEYFALNIPTLLVCGGNDSLVSHELNSKKMIDYVLANNIKNFYYYVKVGDAKEGGEHHPHSFGNIDVDLIYGCKAPRYFNIYSNQIEGSSRKKLKTIESNVSLISWFFYLNAHDVIAQINKQESSKSIKITKGTYHIYPEDVELLHNVFLSNTDTMERTNHGEKHVLLYVCNKNKLTIDCNDSSFILHGPLTPFIFKECENITLCNANFDYLNPTMSEIYVKEKIKDGYIIQINPSCLFNVYKNKLIFHSEINRSGDYYWSYDYRDDDNICLFRDDESHQTKTRVHDKDKTHPCAPSFASVVNLGNNELNVTLSNEGDYFKVGSTLEIRPTIRNEIGGAFVDCKNVLMKNVTFNSIHGFGILSQCSENVRFIGNKILPSRGRKISCNADFFHFSCCRGHIKIKDNQLKEGHDDYINIHGIHTCVSKIIDDHTLIVEFKHNCSYGFNFYKPKDKIALIDKNNLTEIASNVVIESSLLDDYHIQIKLKDKVSPLYLGNYIDNVSISPDVEISNNEFLSSMGRGILVTTRGKCLIDNNRFSFLGGAVLCVADDCNFWYESSLTKDITFKDNFILNCGYNPFGDEKDYEIIIKPEVMDKNSKDYVHGKINIIGNTFIDDNQDIKIKVEYTKNFVMKNNSSNRKIIIDEFCSNVSNDKSNI